MIDENALNLDIMKLNNVLLVMNTVSVTGAYWKSMSACADTIKDVIQSLEKAKPKKEAEKQDDTGA